jgi:hypothetical protein
MRFTLAVAVTVVLASVVIRSSTVDEATQLPGQEPFVCPVTQAGKPGGLRAIGNGNYGNDTLSTILWPGGTVRPGTGGPGFVLEDGALRMKFPWWRLRPGTLRIEGRRLDADAPPLRAHVPCCYGDTGFQATALIFPTPGCWEVTGRVGEGSLTFVTRVLSPR